MNKQLSVTTGDTLRMTVEVYEDSASKDRFNLTGCTVEFSVREENEESPVLTKTNGADLVILEATEGYFSVRLSPAETASLGAVASVYWYKITITTPDSDVYTVANGKLRLT